MFVATSLPASAAAPAAENYVLWLKSNGTYGISPASELKADGYSTCGGLAPLVTACELTGFASFGWLVGWALPPPVAAGLPVGGPAVMSTKLVMTGTNGAQPTIFGCNWAAASAFGFLLPPFVGVSCHLYQFGYNLGNLDVKYTTGSINAQNVAFIGAALPDTSVGPAVGTWQAILYSY